MFVTKCAERAKCRIRFFPPFEYGSAKSFAAVKNKISDVFGIRLQQIVKQARSSFFQKSFDLEGAKTAIKKH